MKILFHGRAGAVAAALAVALIADAQADNTKQAPGAVQSQPPRSEAALTPHGSCPANYKLAFVSQTWIRCSLDPSAPKAPAYAAPVCHSGYTLQDAAASKAPERNLYRCAKA